MNISRRKLVVSGHGASLPKPATAKVGTGARGASKKVETTKRRRKRPSSSSTPSTAKRTVEDVEGLPGSKKPKFVWRMEAGLDCNFVGVGKLLSSLKEPLYEHVEGGLLLVEGDRSHRITSAKELAPFLIDHIRIAVTKKGNFHGEKPSDSVLNNMLRSRSFLDKFLRVEEVATTPILLPDHRPSKPGFNKGGILHLGRTVSTRKSLRHINRFLDVMEWQSSADRTNAVGALLTVPFRRHFVGGKPCSSATFMAFLTESRMGRSDARHNILIPAT